MEKKRITFTSYEGEIKKHLEKVYKKIELQIALHEAFLHGKREIEFLKKDETDSRKTNFKNNFSVS
jgi:hypothetical protein